MRHASGVRCQCAGFTLIEFVVTAGLLVLMAGTAIRFLNPGGRIAAARNVQREAHANALVTAIRANITDNRTGQFVCAGAGDIPTSTAKKMAVGGGNYDIAPCIVPTYLYVMPFDPAAAGAHYASNADYNSGYFVVKNASTGQVTVSAPSAELGKTISVTR